MTDADNIPPALTPEEWSYVLAGRYSDCDRVGDPTSQTFLGVCRRQIAINNAALPADDQRKITWAHVELIRMLAEWRRATAREAPERYGDLIESQVGMALEFADTLESYLLPREM